MSKQAGAASLWAIRVIAEHWHWTAVVALAIILWVPRLAGPIDLRWDGGVYYLLGTSLASGQGYRIPSEPGSPQALQYPPLLPAFVALHQWVSGTANPAAVAPRLRLSYAALFIAYAVAILALARQYLPISFAVLATAFCILHHLTIFLSDLLFAELPFALVSVLFATIATMSKRASAVWPREAASFLLAAAGFLLKTIGVVLFAAWVLDAFCHRRWKLAVVRCALALVPILAWQAHVARVRTSAEYAHPAYEYQRAAYQYSNVTYGENASLLNPFRPELGRVNGVALGQRIVANLPWLMMAVGETLSAKVDTWPLKRWQARLLGRPVPLEHGGISAHSATGGRSLARVVACSDLRIRWNSSVGARCARGRWLSGRWSPPPLAAAYHNCCDDSNRLANTVARTVHTLSDAANAVLDYLCDDWFSDD